MIQAPREAGHAVDPEGGRFDVLGVEVSVVTIDLACERVAGWIRDRERRYVCVTGVHGVMESHRDPALREIHNRAGLTVPDGMPLVWAGRRAGSRGVDRVYGPELMSAICARAAREGWRSFLYGGAPGTADLLAERLRARFPGFEVAGTLSPPFRELTAAEDELALARIDAADADLVWVGLSTPKQERWMAAHIDRLRRPSVLLGVGAAFDIHAGLKRDAPRWLGRSGLHWLYRLGQEPRRLWRRYLRNNPEFAIRILRSPPRLVAVDADPAGGATADDPVGPLDAIADRGANGRAV